jgi:hypothetical protein
VTSTRVSAATSTDSVARTGVVSLGNGLRLLLVDTSLARSYSLGMGLFGGASKPLYGRWPVPYWISPNTDTGSKENCSVRSDKFPGSAVSVLVVGSEGARQRSDERVEQ